MGRELGEAGRRLDCDADVTVKERSTVKKKGWIQKS